jgi:hypothetical protein
MTDVEHTQIGGASRKKGRLSSNKTVECKWKRG